MRVIGMCLLAILAACATEPSVDPCSAYAISVGDDDGSALHVGDTRSVIVTDLDTGEAATPTVTDLATPDGGIVSIDRSSLVARASGVTTLAVEVGACHDAVLVRVE